MLWRKHIKEFSLEKVWETSKCNSYLPKVWWALPSPIPGTSHLGCCTMLHLSACSDTDPIGPCLPPTHCTGGQARAPLRGHSHLGHLFSHELTSEVSMGWTHSAPPQTAIPGMGVSAASTWPLWSPTVCAPCVSPHPELQHAGLIWQFFRPGRFLMSHCSAQSVHAARQVQAIAALLSHQLAQHGPLS